MTFSQEKIDKAVDDRIVEMQSQADTEVQQLDARDKIIKDIMTWDTWPKSATSEQMGAFLAYIQETPTNAARFKEGLIESFQDVINDMQSSDPMELQMMVVAAQHFMPTMQVGTNIMMFVVQPEEEGGDWMIVGAPITIDEDYKVSMPKTLDFDMQMSLFVTPRPNSVTEEFNLAAQFTKAGDPVKAYAISYSPDVDGTKSAHLTGYISGSEGQVQPIMGIASFVIGDDPMVMFGDLMGGQDGPFSSPAP